MNSDIDLTKIKCSILKEEISQPQLQMKAILIGPASAGKSSLLNRAINDEFLNDIEPTIGIAFGVLNMQIENTLLKFQVWDTAGAEQFRSVTKVFYKGSHTVFLIFDMMDENSFSQLNFWVNEIKEECPHNTPIIIIGNKCDERENRQVTREEALQFLAKEKLNEYEETSAKSGENALEIFVKAAKKFFLKSKNTDTKNITSEISITNTPPKVKEKCNC